MWYIGDDKFGTECFVTAVNPHQGIPELDYTVRRGEAFKPLYFETRQQAEDALKLFKAWCNLNYGYPQHRLLENPQIIEVESKQLNLF